MTKKIYEAQGSVICNLTVLIDGRPRRVSFTPVTMYGGSRDSGCNSRFETTDTAMQKALEETRLYNKKYFVVFEETIDEPKNEGSQTEAETSNEKTADIDADTIKVSSPGDARDYLHEHYGIEPKSVWRKADLLKKAEELGIVFEGI